MFKKGFTLIELLIVVIIIGILASIAVPQFFKVAERARAAEAVQTLGALRRAEIRYYSEHGTMTALIGELDYDAPSTIKYFNNPPTAAGGNYTGAAGNNIASMVRNAVSNPGFGTYKLTAYGDGHIGCEANGGKCPAGF